MFHRIVMNIVNVVGQICFVAHRVLPKSSLPQRVFAALVAFDGYALRDDIAVNKLLMWRHRPEKSESFLGKVITIWR